MVVPKAGTPYGANHNVAAMRVSMRTMFESWRLKGWSDSGFRHTAQIVTTRGTAAFARVLRGQRLLRATGARQTSAAPSTQRVACGVTERAREKYYISRRAGRWRHREYIWQCLNAVIAASRTPQVCRRPPSIVMKSLKACGRRDETEEGQAAAGGMRG